MRAMGSSTLKAGTIQKKYVHTLVPQRRALGIEIFLDNIVLLKLVARVRQQRNLWTYDSNSTSSVNNTSYSVTLLRDRIDYDDCVEF